MKSPRASRPSFHVLDLRIPPLAVLCGVGALGWLLSRAAPGWGIESSASPATGAGFVLAGIAVSLLGVRAFRRAKTTVNPTRPGASTALVASGVYRFTRNPMYLGFLLALLGAVTLMENLAAFAVLPVFVLYLNRFQIRPEEAALRSLFGEAYADYQSRVRRWV